MKKTCFLRIIYLSLFIAVLQSCNSNGNGCRPLMDSLLNNRDMLPAEKEALLIASCGRGEVIRKDSLNLVIKTAQGKEVALQSKIDETQTIIYTFAGYYEEGGLYVIRKSGWEWENYLLIERENGERYEVTNMPLIFSPDKKSFASFSSDQATLMDANRFEIWENRGNSWKLTLALNTADEMFPEKSWGPANATWISNEEIDILREVGVNGYGTDSGTKEDGIEKYMKVNGSWVRKTK